MYHLEFPTLAHKSAFDDLLADFAAHGENPRPHRSHMIIGGEDYNQFLQIIQDARNGKVEPNHVPFTFLFMMQDGSDRILGAISIRHYLNDDLRNYAGHIGYGVRPTERRKGVATAMLALALEECRHFGLSRVMLSCDKENIASARTIQKNGGILTFEGFRENKVLQQYWIELSNITPIAQPPTPRYVRVQMRYTGKTARPVGVFVGVWHLREAGLLNPEQTATYEQVDTWFQSHLPNPPFYQQNNPDRAITWFKIDTSNVMLRELQPLMDILDACEKSYDILYSNDIGEVIYEDEFQVAAIDRRALLPILEYDPEQIAIGFSKPKRDIHLPERMILSFFGNVVAEYAQREESEKICETRWENGLLPVYQTRYKGETVGFMHVHVGAPIAAGLMDFCITYGAKKFVACGGCGVLDDVALGHVLIPDSAVRDEGTSYHYLPPSREVVLQKDAVEALVNTAKTTGYAYTVCKTWTTDAINRETENRTARRKNEGCLTVEMECAAFAAVAQFRNVRFAQYLYSGDLVQAKYDDRKWYADTDSRKRLFELALDGVLAF